MSEAQSIHIHNYAGGGPLQEAEPLGKVLAEYIAEQDTPGYAPFPWNNNTTIEHQIHIDFKEGRTYQILELPE